MTVFAIISCISEANESINTKKQHLIKNTSVAVSSQKSNDKQIISLIVNGTNLPQSASEYEIKKDGKILDWWAKHTEQNVNKITLQKEISATEINIINKLTIDITSFN